MTPSWRLRFFRYLTWPMLSPPPVQGFPPRSPELKVGPPALPIALAPLPQVGGMTFGVGFCLQPRSPITLAVWSAPPLRPLLPMPSLSVARSFRPERSIDAESVGRQPHLLVRAGNQARGLWQRAGPQGVSVRTKPTSYRIYCSLVSPAAAWASIGATGSCHSQYANEACLRRSRPYAQPP